MYELDATDSTDPLELESEDEKMHNILEPYIGIIENLWD
jgi:hypothetical protein